MSSSDSVDCSSKSSNRDIDAISVSFRRVSICRFTQTTCYLYLPQVGHLFEEDDLLLPMPVLPAGLDLVVVAFLVRVTVVVVVRTVCFAIS